MLKVSHICKTFTGGIIRKTRVNAVKDVSFTIRDGETFGIVGNSGCGKSTIANMLLSLIKPDSGQLPSRMTLVQIPLTYLSLLWLLRMSIP